MRWLRCKVAIIPVVLGTVLIGAIAGLPNSALAQPPYPIPTDATVTVSVDQATVEAAGSITITCTVLDATGVPLGPPEAATCNFVVTSQPGTDATISPASAQTSATGEATATLSAGSVPGTIVITIRVETVAGTSVESQVTVTVQEPELTPGLPPPELPPTAAEPDDGIAAWQAWLVGLAIAAAAAVLAVLGWRLYSRRSHDY